MFTSHCVISQPVYLPQVLAVVPLGTMSSKSKLLLKLKAVADLRLQLSEDGHVSGDIELIINNACAGIDDAIGKVALTPDEGKQIMSEISKCGLAAVARTSLLAAVGTAMGRLGTSGEEKTQTYETFILYLKQSFWDKLQTLTFEAILKVLSFFLASMKLRNPDPKTTQLATAFALWHACNMDVNSFDEKELHAKFKRCREVLRQAGARLVSRAERLMLLPTDAEELRRARPDIWDFCFQAEPPAGRDVEDPEFQSFRTTVPMRNTRNSVRRESTSTREIVSVPGKNAFMLDHQMLMAGMAYMQKMLHNGEPNIQVCDKKTRHAIRPDSH